LFKGAVGHVDRAEDPIAHDFRERKPERVHLRELLDHDASTQIVRYRERRANQSDWASIGGRLAIEYLKHRMAHQCTRRHGRPVVEGRARQFPRGQNGVDILVETEFADFGGLE
jgi:hypothetical protein